MGKVAGAALTVAAPEAKAARAAASARRRRPAAADPRVTSPGSKAAQQRESIERIKANRPAEPAPAPESPAPPSPGAGLSAPALPAGATAAASSGSGFLLGVVLWALALNYLQGGPAQVRKFAAAKLFNKV